MPYKRSWRRKKRRSRSQPPPSAAHQLNSDHLGRINVFDKIKQFYRRHGKIREFTLGILSTALSAWFKAHGISICRYMWRELVEWLQKLINWLL